MSIKLGENPWILIFLIFMELFLIIIPALIASYFEDLSFKEELNEMGFKKNKDNLICVLSKIFLGLLFGIILFLIGGYILIFFRDIIIKSIFGNVFIQKANEGSIESSPIEPTMIQLILIIILQIIIIGPCEEGFFRGFILKKLNKKLNKFNSILISSTLFAIYHIPPFLVPFSTILTYFGYYFVFGVILALIFEKCHHSLIPGSVAHSFFNILIILF